MRNLLYIPAVIFFLLPVLRLAVNAASERAKEREQAARKAEADARLKDLAEQQKQAAEQARAAREQEQQHRRIERERRQAEKLEKARLLAEYNERAAAAAKELKAQQTANRTQAAAPVLPDPEEKKAERKPAPPITPEQFLSEYPPEPVKTFQGKSVSFTGRIPGMTRAQAIEAVQQRGGKAFEKMPAQVNILVIGEKPGMNKLDLADERIGQVKKITAEQFLSMLAA